MVFAQDDNSKLVDNQTNQEFSAASGPFLLSTGAKDFVVKGQIVAFGQDTNRHWGFFVASVKGGKVKVVWARADIEGVTLKPAKLEHLASCSDKYALLTDNELEAAKMLVWSAARNTATADEVCRRSTKRSRKKTEFLTYNHKDSGDECITICHKQNKCANKKHKQAAKDATNDAAAANSKIKQLQNDLKEVKKVLKQTKVAKNSTGEVAAAQSLNLQAATFSLFSHFSNQRSLQDSRLLATVLSARNGCSPETTPKQEVSQMAAEDVRLALGFISGDLQDAGDRLVQWNITGGLLLQAAKKDGGLEGVVEELFPTANEFQKQLHVFRLKGLISQQS